MCTPTSGQKSKRKRQVSSPPSIPGGREEKGGVGVYQLAADTPTAGKKSKRKKQVSSPPSIPGGREEKGCTSKQLMCTPTYGQKSFTKERVVLSNPQ